MIQTLPLALTMGDPAGVGSEIALAAWASGRVTQPFFLIGDPAHLGPLALYLRYFLLKFYYYAFYSKFTCKG